MKYPVLTPEHRLFIETHMCCVESTARGILLVQLRKKYKSLDISGRSVWDRAMEKEDDDTHYPSFDTLSNTAVFQDIIAYATKNMKPYADTKPGSFRLMRDEFMHGPSKRFVSATLF